METFTIEELTFTYPDRDEPALEGINLNIHKGEFLAVCGQSGSGKTTLLRNLKPALTPAGKRNGTIRYEGRNLDSLSHKEQAGLIGYVMQNPDNQIVTDKVWHELAFGLESLGIDQNIIRLRVAEMASFFGIESWFHREVHTLSGGQKQLLNLAAVMVMQPQVLILDEPVSQLDPIAAGDFIETVIRINRELGTTVIISEHRLDEVIPAADRVLVMAKGRTAALGAPEDVCARLLDMSHPMFRSMPVPAQIAAMSSEYDNDKSIFPLTVRDGRRWLDAVLADYSLSVTRINETGRPQQAAAVEMKNIWFAYNKGEDVIRGLDLKVYSGEILAVLGGNGTGKTTLLGILSGINRRQRGKMKNSLRTSMLPQNPQTLFTEDTVFKELAVMRRDMGEGSDAVHDAVMRIAKQVDIMHILDSHPYDISGGEQQRAALAKVLLTEPELLLLDEPTKGMDNSFKEKLAAILRQLQKDGMTIVMVSHDVEFCGANADRCAMMFDGIIVTEGTPGKYFAGNSFYTTAANRMSRHVFENAVSGEDVVELIARNIEGSVSEGKADVDDTEDNNGNEGHAGGCSGDDSDKPEREDIECVKVKDDGIRRNAGYGIEAVMLILAAATVYAGYFISDNHRYMVVSLLLILYAMVPFFWKFERRQPKAREIVLIVVMVTAAVVGRGAFFMIPNFKPMLAIVIIAGAAMGRESGFLTGAMAAFVSNFFFGQGPWTPWQMIASALVGYLAGVLFYRVSQNIRNAGRIQRAAIIVFGACAAFVLYGGIVDIWTILAITDEPTTATVLGVYGAALYFNLVHGLATAVFLMLLARPMITGINRVKRKYGVNYS